MELAKRVWDFSTSRDLLHPGDRVVLGVSGGPDSLCLLDVLHRLANRRGLELVVAHLNHGLRPEAGAEADFVRVEAEKRGWLFKTETNDVTAAARLNKQSLEMAARELRYDFLSRVARQASANLVAVAHTADDQAETVLLHLLRGTGLRGLAGMRPKRAIGAALFLIRPLLQVSRAEVQAYCAEHKLEPRLDGSNSDTKYLRNRVRQELLPALETYNPNVRVGLARLAESAAGDYDIWRGAVQALWQRTSSPEAGSRGGPPQPAGPVPAGKEDQVVFRRRQWLALNGPERRALLRLAIEHLTGNLDETNFAPIDAAAEFSRQALPGRSCQVVAGFVLRVDTHWIKLVRSSSLVKGGDWPRLQGAELAPGWRLVVETLEMDKWTEQEVADAPRWTAYVDAGRLNGSIGLRPRRAGDQFQPMGMDGHTVKLTDFLINRKVPVIERENWPLVTCGDDIVWVVGLRLDERYKVSAATRTVGRLEFRRVDAHAA